MELEPMAEYVITDVYLPTMKGNPRERGDLHFRTDLEGSVWIKGAGRPEDAALVRWFADHPRLKRVTE